MKDWNIGVSGKIWEKEKKNEKVTTGNICNKYMIIEEMLKMTLILRKIICKEVSWGNCENWLQEKRARGKQRITLRKIMHLII